MDFNNVEIKNEMGELINPYASRINESWVPGTVRVDFLNERFGYLKTAQEMIDATESEGLKLYFTWLRDEKGILR